MQAWRENSVAFVLYVTTALAWSTRESRTVRVEQPLAERSVHAGGDCGYFQNDRGREQSRSTREWDWRRRETGSSFVKIEDNSGRCVEHEHEHCGA